MYRTVWWLQLTLLLWYIRKLLQEQILWVLITMKIFFPFSFSFYSVCMKRWVLVEPTAVMHFTVYVNQTAFFNELCLKLSDIHQLFLNKIGKEILFQVIINIWKMNVILPKILFAIYDHDVESFSKLFYIKIQVNLLEPSITDLLPLWQKHNEEVTEMRNKKVSFWK